MFETENWRERAVRRSTETNEESSSVNAGYGRNWRVGAIDVLRRNDSGASRVSPLKLALTVRGWNSVGGLYHLTGHGHEFVQTRTWDDDRVPTTVRFLGDTHKAPSFIFAEFNIEVLTFDLEFFRDNYVIHDAWRAST
jgi:hypothetical protein